MVIISYIPPTLTGVNITYIPSTLTDNSSRTMSPKRPSSNTTPAPGKAPATDATQGDRGRGQSGQPLSLTGQAGKHQGAIFQAKSSARQPQTEPGPARTPTSARPQQSGSHPRAPSAGSGSNSPLSPGIQGSSPSDTDIDSNPGDGNSPNNKGGSPIK